MHIATESQDKLSKTVLVLGAGGRLGQAATKAFAQAGWTVLAQARKPIHTERWANVRHIRADALEVESIVAQSGDVDVIVHAINPDYARWEQLLPPVNAAVLALAKKLDALIMIPGNVYNFGKDLPSVLTETTPFVANTDKARQRIAMEASFATAVDVGVRTVVIRAGDFIGGSGTWLDMGISKQLHKGVFTSMGPDHIAHAWAYLPDLAQVFVRVAEKRDQLAAYEVLHFPGYHASQQDLQSTFELLLGQRLQQKPMAWNMMQVIAWFSPLLRAVLKMRYLWQRPHQLSGEKLMRLIGPIPQTPMKLALREYLPTNKKSQEQMPTEISLKTRNQ